MINHKVIALNMKFVTESPQTRLSKAISILDDAAGKCSPKKAAIIKAFQKSLIDLDKKFQNIDNLKNAEEKKALLILKKTMALPMLTLAKSIEYFSNPKNTLNATRGEAAIALNWYQSGMSSLGNIMKKAFIYEQGIRIGIPTALKLGFETLANLADDYLAKVSDNLGAKKELLTNQRTKLTQEKNDLQQKQSELKAKLKEAIDSNPNLENSLRSEIESNAHQIRHLRLEIDTNIARCLSIDSSRFGLGFVSGTAHGAALGVGSMGYLFMAPEVIATNFINEVIKVTSELKTQFSKKELSTDSIKAVQNKTKHGEINSRTYELGKKFGTVAGLLGAAHFIGGPLFESIFHHITDAVHEMHTVEEGLHFLKFAAVLYGEITFAAVESVMIIANLPTTVKEMFATKLQNKLEAHAETKAPHKRDAMEEFTEKFMKQMRDILGLD